MTESSSSENSSENYILEEVSEESNISYIPESSSDSSSEEVNSGMTLNLDQNAGGFPEELSGVNLYLDINNLHGYQNQKIMLRKEIEGYRRNLLELFGFDRVFYNTGATETINALHRLIPELFVFEGNHFIADKIKKDRSNKFACLINLVNSSSGYLQNNQIQSATKAGYKYIIVDCTQAIGRINIPNQQNVDCIFFSTHKYGGNFSSGFLFMSDEFFKEVFEQSVIKHEFDYKDIDNDFLAYPGGTFNHPSFIHDYFVTKNVLNSRPNLEDLKFTYSKIMQVLKDTPGIILQQPELQNGQENLYSSILFKVKSPACVKSLQNYLADAGINIGFSTACTTGENGILRISWRNALTQEQLDFFDQTFKDTTERVFELSEKKTGGAKNSPTSVTKSKNYEQGLYNLKQVNSQKYWLHFHWVKHSDKPVGKIPEKYAICFQDFILNNNIDIGLRVPELAYRKRISKHFWVNPDKRQLDKREQIVVKPQAWITIKDFAEQEENGSYPNLPDIISQEFDCSPARDSRCSGYFMSRRKYEWIKNHGLDISHEYQQQGGMSEFVLKMKVPIYEMFISASNSYKNNRQFVFGKSPCQRYRTGEDTFEYMKSEKKEKNDKDDDAKKDIIGGALENKIYAYTETYPKSLIGKCVFVLQPNSTANEMKKAKEVLDELIAKKASVVYIVDSPNKKYLNDQMKKVEERYCLFDCFQYYWYYDSSVEIYTYNF